MWRTKKIRAKSEADPDQLKMELRMKITMRRVKTLWYKYAVVARPLPSGFGSESFPVGKPYRTQPHRIPPRSQSFKRMISEILPTRRFFSPIRDPLTLATLLRFKFLPHNGPASSYNRVAGQAGPPQGLSYPHRDLKARKHSPKAYDLELVGPRLGGAPGLFLRHILF